MLDIPLNVEDWSPWSYEDAFKGYQKIVIGKPPPVVPTTYKLPFGNVQRQWVRRQGDVLRVKSKVLHSKELADVEASFQKAVPMSPTRMEPLNESDLIAALERALSSHCASDKEYLEYAAYSAHHPQRRLALGLPEHPLIINERLSRTRHHIRGIHSSLVYFSLGQSFDFIHKGEVDLQSATYLWHGHAIVWVVVSPRHSTKLESRMVEHLGVQHKCSQFVRHEQIIVLPSTLRSWGIDFSIFMQLPGDAVRTDYQTYRYLWKTGPNLLETVSCCEADWGLPPPIYVYCAKGDAKCGTCSRVTAAAMEITEPRPLEICESSDEDEINAGAGESDQQSYRIFEDAMLNTEKCQQEAAMPVDGHGLLNREIKGTSDNTQGDPNGIGVPHISPLENPGAPFSPPLASSNSTALSSIHPSLPKPHSHVDDPDDLYSSLFLSSPDNSSNASGSLGKSRSISPGSDHYISTAHLSARRLPAPPPPRTVTTSSLNSPEDISEGDIGDSSSELESNGPGEDRHLDRGEHNEGSLAGGISIPQQGSPPTPSGFLPEGSILAPSILGGSLDQSLALRSSSAVDVISITSSPVPAEVDETEGYSRTALSPGKAARLRSINSDTPGMQIVQDIEDLIEVGVQNWKGIGWRTVRPEDTEKILTKFRPDEWLNDDTIMEILYRLTSKRDDVHVVQSHDFSAAYEKGDTKRVRRWKSPSIVLIPVYQPSHWFLVSLNFEHRRITMHEREERDYPEIKFFVSSLVDKVEEWTVEHQCTLKNDGNNCGIILLKEAEAVLNPIMEDFQDFNLLRKRYLLVILDDIMEGHREAPVDEPSNTAVNGTNSPISNAATQKSPVVQPGQRKKSAKKGKPIQHKKSAKKVNLDCLASALGGKEVLQDFQDMVIILRDMPRKAGSDIDMALRMHDDARGYQTSRSELRDSSDDLLQNSKWNVDIALQLYNHENPSTTSSAPEECPGDTPSIGGDNVQTALRLFNRGRGYQMLGALQKDIAALHISRLFRILTDEFREGANERKNAKRRKYNRKPPPPGEPGKGADSYAYKKLLHASASRDTLRTTEDLKSANSRGSRLLQYEAVCGRNHPLWMLLPARSVQCSLHLSCTVKHSEYRKLDEEQTQVLVDHVKTQHPRLWESLPKLEQETARIFRGEPIELQFLQALEEVLAASPRSTSPSPF
ncbi:uncharacterized protein Z519_12731 [Cladophialophora bantiana CBS 173.52]|uniref:Ubiquitin-like protease family profile domain-containing protein n=1 Tax=Cladophialophora bantiana (strain ATCC 10958 / CBS 173.52 / CDC B-1940 / NIH 8579) TaxID=1442370 RepID=A0A0D2E974_CLAB1|nr:uncharacterized protein Z519_12731 [Cladophialophora bantiana CBS 173.52]KIW86676.1 hypothetical protein Z519_12731 [Cladophialophora bantiana CBS 173.52]